MSTPSLVFRKSDYPSSGLGSNEALETFFRTLNGGIQNLQSGVNSALAYGSTVELKTVTIQTPLSDWTAIGSFSNSWGAYGHGRQVPQYRKRADGVVELGGEMKNGTIGSPAFTLPTGYCPAMERFISAFSYTGSAISPGAVTIMASGVVNPAIGDNAEFSLDGVSFACSDNSPGVLSCFPVTVATQAKQPSAVFLGSLVDQTTSGSIAAPGNLHWKNFGPNQIQILNLPGLSLGRTYQLALLVVSQG